MKNSPGFNPSGRISWRGHVSLSEDSRREVCTHASNLMLISVGVAGSPAAWNNRRASLARFRSTDGGAAAVRRRNDYTRDSWNYAKYTARGEETLLLLVGGSRASPDVEGCANNAHDRHVRGAAFAAEMQMVTSLSSWGWAFLFVSRTGGRVACAELSRHWILSRLAIWDYPFRPRIHPA